MKARYLILMWAFVCPALSEEPRVFDNAGLKTVVDEAVSSLETSAAPHDVAAGLKTMTYGKRVSLSGANVTDLIESDALPVREARHFAGLYVLEGDAFPEPSSLEGAQVAETLRELMPHAGWRVTADAIECSGAGLVFLDEEDQYSLSYAFLTSTYTLRRLRLGQLVSLEATISGLTAKDGELQVFGVISAIQGE